MKQVENKKEQKEQEEPKRLVILLRTMVNGYMLDDNNEGLLSMGFL